MSPRELLAVLFCIFTVCKVNNFLLSPMPVEGFLGPGDEIVVSRFRTAAFNLGSFLR